MPTFLADPPQAVVLMLAAALMVVGGVWFNRRTRRSLLAFVGLLGVTALLLLVDALVESPREEAVRRVQEMAKAADEKNSEAFVSHLAESVEYRGASATLTLSRESIRRAPFWNLLRHNNGHVATWDFSRSDVVQVDVNTVEIGFMAKGEAAGKPFPLYFRATFARQPDGQMKITSFASFDPVRRTNERVELGQYLK
jgi:hypothetical protein